MLEVSAPGPGNSSVYNTWDNQNGTIRDWESVAYLPLSGKSGTSSLSPQSLGLIPSDSYLIRIVPMNAETPQQVKPVISAIFLKTALYRLTAGL